MAFEHRGFRVSVDVAPDEAGMQWQCKATIEGVESGTRDKHLPSVDLTISRLKIDVLMAISMVEHKAVDSIDEFLASPIEAT
jgi:hypothetical protein